MIFNLDHVNLRTPDLQRAVEWYGRVLNMHPGARPDFRFSGAWLYAGDHPIIHLVEDNEIGADKGQALTLEHFALASKGYNEFMIKLKSNDISFYEARISSGAMQIAQVNIHDPDGNHIHVDFPLEEVA